MEATGSYYKTRKSMCGPYKELYTCKNKLYTKVLSLTFFSCFLPPFFLFPNQLVQFLGSITTFPVSNKAPQVPSMFSGFSLQHENFITSTIVLYPLLLVHFLSLCFPSCTHFLLLSTQTLKVILSLWLPFRLFPQHYAKWLQKQ